MQVHMDCPGCEAKIRKALEKLKGVDNVDIDMAMQKVTVTGWADQKKVLKTVRKTGRRAEIWQLRNHNYINNACYSNRQHHHNGPSTYYAPLTTTTSMVTLIFVEVVIIILIILRIRPRSSDIKLVLRLVMRILMLVPLRDQRNILQKLYIHDICYFLFVFDKL